MNLNLKGVESDMARVESPYLNLLHHQSRKEKKLKVFFFTIIGIALISAAVALVVAWLLAGGVIDPQDQGQRLALIVGGKETSRGKKESRALNYESSINQLTEDVRKVASYWKISEENLLKEISSDIKLDKSIPTSTQNVTDGAEEVSETVVNTEQTVPMPTSPDIDKEETTQLLFDAKDVSETIANTEQTVAMPTISDNEKEETTKLSIDTKYVSETDVNTEQTVAMPTRSDIEKKETTQLLIDAKDVEGSGSSIN